VFVLYADEESLTLMTPQGHMFAGWITFSGERAGHGTVMRADVLMRANYPLYELAMTFGGHRKEDLFWAQTLTALGSRPGMADGRVETKTVRGPQAAVAARGQPLAQLHAAQRFQALASPFTAQSRRAGRGGPGGAVVNEARRGEAKSTRH
jgi:hypothetical protein